MDNRERESIGRIKKLCVLAGIDFNEFLEETEIELKNRIKALLEPNKMWYEQGKTIERYWKFLESITGHKWDYEDVDYWYKFLRGPSDTREEVQASLRYQVLSRDRSICQKCGRAAPLVKLHVDHILPWDCGGPTVIDNLQTLCEDCNQGKSNKCFERGDNYAK